MTRVYNSFYSCLLQPFKSDTFRISTITQLAIGLADGTKEYKVDNIVSQETWLELKQNLFKLTGYPDHENKWQTEKN